MGGAETRALGKAGQQQAADVYGDLWAQRPSTFGLEGKPLLLVDTDDNHGPGDGDDVRFAVCWAYNGDDWEAMGRRGQVMRAGRRAQPCQATVIREFGVP